MRVVLTHSAGKPFWIGMGTTSSHVCLYVCRPNVRSFYRKEWQTTHELLEHSVCFSTPSGAQMQEDFLTT